jgi:hypothetical protein
LRDDIVELATAADTPRSYVTHWAREVARGWDLLDAGEQSTYAERAWIAETIVTVPGLRPVDAVRAQDVAQTKKTAAIAVVERARVGDRSRARTATTLTETAWAADAPEGLVLARVLERARLGDVTGTQYSAWGPATERARASDYGTRVETIDVTEAAALVDAPQATLTARTDATEIAGAVEDFVAWAVQAARVAEVAQATDASEGQLFATNDVTEYMALEDTRMPEADGAGVAWTANTENWALSRYMHLAAARGIGLSGKVPVGWGDSNTRYAYAPRGGRVATPAWVTWAMVDYGIKQSLPHTVYAELAQDGQMPELHVVAPNASLEDRELHPWTVWRYPLAPQELATPRAVRWLVGRGLRNRRFAFTVYWPSVRAMAMDSFYTAHDTSMRRV